MEVEARITLTELETARFDIIKETEQRLDKKLWEKYYERKDNPTHTDKEHRCQHR